MSAEVKDQTRPRLPLGKLLVEAGLLSEENLELALAAQKGTDRPLGQILVERGLVAFPIVANALAEQHGGALKTEYGFATGLTSKEPASGLPPLLPPTSPFSLGKKPWGADDDGLPPRQPTWSSDPAAANSGAAPAAAVAEVAEPTATATALLVALNDDDSIDQVEAAVAALRRALASEQGSAPLAPPSVRQPSTSAAEAATARAELAARVAELEAELESLSAARDEATAALEVALAEAAAERELREAFEAQLDRQAEELRARLVEVPAQEIAAPSASVQEDAPAETVMSVPSPDAEDNPDDGAVKDAGGATPGVGLFAPPRLGDILVRNGRITSEQLKEALVESRQTGDRLGRVLLRAGWVFEEELSQTLAAQWQIPYVSLQRVGVDPDTACLLPREIGMRFAVIPVRMKGERVQVAFADPSDEQAVEAIAPFLPSIDLAVADLSDIEMMWRSFPSQTSYREAG